MSRSFKEVINEHNKKESERYGFKCVEDYDKVRDRIFATIGTVFHERDIYRVKKEMGL